MIHSNWVQHQQLTKCNAEEIYNLINRMEIIMQ